MKFSIYGNCQARPAEICIRSLLPEAEVTGYHLGISTLPDKDDADLILAVPEVAKSLRMEADSRLRLIPTIVFTGFHPDCTYVFQNGKVIQSPMGPYNSSLVAACFLKGVPEEQVITWFNAPAFEAIGFFHEFERSKRFLLDYAHGLDLDLSLAIEEWVDGETAFMHTINHPAIRPVYDLCRAALAREGITDVVSGAVPPDPLTTTKWPIYDIIARHIGIEEQPFVMHGETIDLDEFIFRSYQMFRTLPRDAIEKTPSIVRVLTAMLKAGL